MDPSTIVVLVGICSMPTGKCEIMHSPPVESRVACRVKAKEINTDVAKQSFLSSKTRLKPPYFVKATCGTVEQAKEVAEVLRSEENLHSDGEGEAP